MRFGVRASGVALAALLAFAAGRAIPAAAPPLAPQPARAPEGGRPAAPAAPAAPSAPPPPDAPVGADPLALDAHRAQNEALDAELHGGPLRWPDAAAERRAHDELRATLEAVVAGCHPDASLTAIDCEEEPCVGVVWFDAAEPLQLHECPAWVDRYTLLHRMEEIPVPCGEDGTAKGLAVVAPPHDLDVDAPAQDADVPRDWAVYQQEQARVELRLGRIRDREAARCP